MSLQKALSLHQSGQLNEAMAAYQELLRGQPNNPQVLYLFGTLLHQTGQTKAAIQYLEQSLKLQPNQADAWYNLANIHRSLGNVNPALSCYQRAFQLDPKNAQQAFNFAVLLMHTGQQSGAKQVCENIIRHQAEFTEAYGMLGDIALNLQQFDEAEQHLQKALSLNPEHPELLYSMGFVLESKGQLAKAAEYYQTALSIQPDHGAALSALIFAKRRLADWDGIDSLNKQLLQAVQRGVRDITPFSFLAETDLPELHKQCAATWASSVQSRIPKIPPQPFKRETKSQLTIGYLSADFYQHPTAYLAAGMFEAHDRNNFKIIAYSNSRDDGSSIRQRLESSFDVFHDIRSKAPIQVAEQIVNDGVDILVDLKGYTLEACTEIMAFRAAPVQVNYLGYPGTMAADFIDYIIGDPVVTPLEHAPQYSECIAQIPCYQINDDKRPRPDQRTTRIEHGLPDDSFVYCCFNNTWKFNHPQFDLYLKILNNNPDSVLWLMAKESSEEVISNLRMQASQAGINPERLIFTNPKPLEDYLELFHHADLFLDSFPYNAHTTASDALWMGCPVLTLQGESFASRVASSLLQSVLGNSAKQLITLSSEEFVETATRLNQSPELLTQLTTELSTDKQLFNTKSTTRHIELAYQQMYQQFITGNKTAIQITGDEPQ